LALFGGWFENHDTTSFDNQLHGYQYTPQPTLKYDQIIVWAFANTSWFTRHLSPAVRGTWLSGLTVRPMVPTVRHSLFFRIPAKLAFVQMETLVCTADSAYMHAYVQRRLACILIQVR
jgi:hypothetical protein